MRAWISIALLVGGLGVGPAAEAGALRHAAVRAPDSGAPTRLTRLLREQSELARVSGSIPMYVVVRFPPRAGVEGDVRVALQPTGRVRKAGRIRDPSTVLGDPGIYLGVTASNGGFIHLIPTGDPRFVRGEWSDRGVSRARIVEMESGVISTRVPFVAGGSLWMFEVDQTGAVGEVFFKERLTVLLQGSSSSPFTRFLSWLTGVPPSLFASPGLSEVLLEGGAFSAPPLYHVTGGASSENATNVLIVGDGFTLGDQAAFRAASHELALELRNREIPFCHYRDSLSFYRFHLTDSEHGIPSHGMCPTVCSSSGSLPVDSTFVEPYSKSVAAGSEQPASLGSLVDLEVSNCWDDICRLMWASEDGQLAIRELVSLYPEFNFSIVVVLGNSSDSYGGGLFNVATTVDRLAVVGVPMQEGEEGWSASEMAHNIFAHEFGHTFGLLDEYADVEMVDSVWDPAGDRNVWIPETSLPTDETSLPDIPWADLMPGCDVENRVACCGVEIETAVCQECSGVPDPPECTFVPALCGQDPISACFFASDACVVPDSCPEMVTPRDDACLHEDCTRGVSLFEGALYEWTGRYRAEYDCLMRSRDADVPFCQACLLVMKDYFRDSESCLDLHEIWGECPPYPASVEVLGPADF